MVVGGIWVPPPPEYTSATATSDEAGHIIRPTNGVYAPKASKMQQSGRNYSDKNGSFRQTTSRSNSPVTSSSAHTNIASPAF